VFFFHRPEALRRWLEASIKWPVGPCEDKWEDWQDAGADNGQNTPEICQRKRIMGRASHRSTRRSFKDHRNPIHAIAQACHRRSVVEDVAKVAPASCAMNRCPYHADGSVSGRTDSVIGKGCPETWPARAAFELRFRREESMIATNAGEDAWAMLIEQRARKWAFGRALTQYRVLSWCQQLAPFGVGMGHCELFGS
jgi:hypothetical protein